MREREHLRQPASQTEKIRDEKASHFHIAKRIPEGPRRVGGSIRQRRIADLHEGRAIRADEIRKTDEGYRQRYYAPGSLE